jgi:hypothetical protein
MDLNLDNYDNIELLNILHLPIKNDYTLYELKNTTINHIKIILDANDNLIYNKKNIVDFFIQVFLKLANKCNIKVAPCDMEEFDLVIKSKIINTLKTYSR